MGRNNAEKKIFDLAVAKNGNWNDIYKAITNHDVADEMPDIQGNYITLIGSDYPNRLKHANKPPIVLFYKGDIDLLKSDNIIAICGTRAPSYEGKAITNTIASCIKVASFGANKGIEDMCIDLVEKPIVVLACGFDKEDKTLIDKVLKKGGLILTEYPLGVEKTSDNFLNRNRIIVGVANKTLVLEAANNGSAVVRVCEAMSIGQDVYVVPHSLDDYYINNSLIKDGAMVCTEASDLYESTI